MFYDVTQRFYDVTQCLEVGHIQLLIKKLSTAEPGDNTFYSIRLYACQSIHQSVCPSVSQKAVILKFPMKNDYYQSEKVVCNP